MGFWHPCEPPTHERRRMKCFAPGCDEFICKNKKCGNKSNAQKDTWLCRRCFLDELSVVTEEELKVAKTPCNFVKKELAVYDRDSG